MLNNEGPPIPPGDLVVGKELVYADRTIIFYDQDGRVLGHLCEAEILPEHQPGDSGCHERSTIDHKN